MNTLSLFADERQTILSKIADDFGSPRLTAEPLPPQAWGKNLWTLLRRRDWDRIRKAAYAAAGNRCEICRGVGAAFRVACHERWLIEEWCCTSTLVGVVALCPACHDVKHIGRAIAHGRYEDAAQHLRRVNGWSARDVARYLKAIHALWELRAREERWFVDVRPWLRAQKIETREAYLRRYQENGTR